MIVFLDACTLIYLIEARAPFVQRARAALHNLLNNQPSASIAVSRLAWLECRIGPMRRNDHGALSRFDMFFARPDLIWVDLDRNVVELATEIRARHGLRTPDALQAASCLQLGPDHCFVTGDTVFQRVAGLHTALF